MKTRKNKVIDGAQVGWGWVPHLPRCLLPPGGRGLLPLEDALVKTGRDLEETCGGDHTSHRFVGGRLFREGQGGGTNGSGRGPGEEEGEAKSSRGEKNSSKLYWQRVGRRGLYPLP